MDQTIKKFWRKRFSKLKQTLEKNDFEAFIADNAAEAGAIVLEQIIPSSGARRITYGDSSTCEATGLFEALKSKEDIEFIDLFNGKVQTMEAWLELARPALLVDMFIAGTNAITETGMLVNLDGVGNRVGGITFGPKEVVILVGRNKVVPDLEAATKRIKDYAAPANAVRLDKKTPCAKTTHCMDCKGPERICRMWSIVERPFPQKRIKVVLINEDLGL